MDKTKQNVTPKKFDITVRKRSYTGGVIDESEFKHEAIECTINNHGALCITLENFYLHVYAPGEWLSYRTSECIEEKIRKIKEKHRVKNWMQNNLSGSGDYTKPSTSTELAENAAQEFNLYEDEVSYKIPDWVFEVSEQVLPTE